MYEKFCVKEVFQCRKEDNERRFRSVKRLSLGCAGNPQEIFKETQASKHGDAPVHLLLHQQSSVRPSPHYIFIASHVMCCSWSVFALSLLLVLFCLLFIPMSEPNMLDWERCTLHFIIEHSRASLIFVEC